MAAHETRIKKAPPPAAEQRQQMDDWYVRHDKNRAQVIAQYASEADYAYLTMISTGTEPKQPEPDEGLTLAER